ncbi:DeoR family transcriptional regulator [Paenibacillus sp. J31TS4]|uniref:DeoR/GlpR family DNA-binding transcription regulator n=1 Tax=Paenibacillus sp. J31TS4 TaxID=2807195 RepID=UPI001B26DF8C|nr:DeoR/GlpR family DNA-binding transcription regulator [Paenibacillus sp. J31TS4]GIP41096.1 DeoR family transcriptional regulator [Paenibacillus sp. J31TS4]
MTEALFGEERRRQIVELLNRNGRVEVRQLAEQFKVTPDAIRKDLRWLESRALAQRTYGGAVPPTSVSGFVAYRNRGEPDRKMPLVKAALSLIQPGETVFLESSSYTDLMMNEMDAVPGVTVITNSLHGLAGIAGKVKLLHTGGSFHEEDEAFYGPMAIQTIRQLNVDKCFLRTSGIGTDGRVTTSLSETMELKKAVMAQARQTVLMVDESNWNHWDRFNVCELREMHVVVTNGLPDEMRAKLNRWKVPIVCPTEEVPEPRLKGAIRHD